MPRRARLPPQIEQVSIKHQPPEQEQIPRRADDVLHSSKATPGSSSAPDGAGFKQQSEQPGTGSQTRHHIPSPKSQISTFHSMGLR